MSTPEQQKANAYAHIDISKPRYSQDTYMGRAKHFFDVCDPRTAFASTAQLYESKAVVDAVKAGRYQGSEEDMWKAKKLYDSAFHPQSGELQFLPGRMSFQVPGNMVIVGCMMTFYKSSPAVVFWQWINQTFNAVVNYTNRNTSSELETSTLAGCYAAATGSAVGVALGFNKMISSNPVLQHGLVGRLVPIAAMAAGNCANIPLMRQKELAEGIDVTDRHGHTLGKSQAAAKMAVASVIFSRVLMATPAMLIPGMVMNRVEKTAWMQTRMHLRAPMAVGLVGLNLVFSTPLACAFFEQNSSLSVSMVESKFGEMIDSAGEPVQKVFFNKGL